MNRRRSQGGTELARNLPQSAEAGSKLTAPGHGTAPFFSIVQQMPEFRVFRIQPAEKEGAHRGRIFIGRRCRQIFCNFDPEDGRLPEDRTDPSPESE